MNKYKTQYSTADKSAYYQGLAKGFASIREYEKSGYATKRNIKADIKTAECVLDAAAKVTSRVSGERGELNAYKRYYKQNFEKGRERK